MLKQMAGTSFVVALGLVFMVSGCGGSTEESSSGGGAGSSGQAGSGGTAGTGGSGGGAGTAGSSGQAGTGGAAGQAGTGGAAGTGGVAGTGGAAGQAGTGGGMQSGDCDDLDPNHVCPDNGSTCTEVVPGGFRVCALDPVEATACTGNGMDECCDSSECATGKCFANPPVPAWGCGGAQPLDMNVCAEDLCTTDGDCQGADQFCVPLGVFGNAIRFCAPGSCRSDADCAAKAGGTCAPVKNPCCSNWIGLFCVYPDGCRTDADCDANQYCDADYVTGTGECRDGGPMCPA